MYPWFPEQPDDAISILKRDHDSVKLLFQEFEHAKSAAKRREIVKQALQELKVHAALEEEIFYPAVSKVGKDIMNEAVEEHHVAHVLIAELEKMDERDEFYDAKFAVLAESVRHHIKEEENEIMPRALDLPIDLVELRHVIERRREELLATGVPATGRRRPKTRTAS